MDAPFQELLIGLASNGLTELAAHSAARGNEPVSADAVQEAVASATSQLTDVEEILPTLGGEQLRQFLCSAEAHNVVRQIFASTEPKQLNAVKREFVELWRSRTGALSDESRDGIDRLFTSLLDICQRSLDQAIVGGSLSAADARAAQRHAELQGALASIERTLAMLSRSSDFSVAEIDDYADKYQRQLIARDATITPPALDAIRQVPIDSLYVPASLEAIGPRTNETIGYTQFAETLFRHVVLGNPGSGKSTLAKKLAADLARNKLSIGHRPNGVIPFLVVLRDFGAQKHESPCSIVDFIASTSNSRYQLAPPPAAIEYLLLTNRAVVIFDGLDELLDTSYRAEISGDVESFGTLYPSAPILVTSREVGYPQAPLSPDVFTASRLSSFTNGQVKRYARNWFKIADESLADEATGQADAFMSDSEGVSDLRSNALMLGLMCNLYKGSGYIPRNRPDVYEACAEMLFDRWDRLRQIGKPLNIESLLRPAMQHLAAWIYGDGELQSGVTEKALVTTASDFLHNRRFENQDEAELEAKRFIEFCRGRAWVFTDTGTTPSGERLYQFTHRTFLEFFTAGHLVRTNPSPEKLLSVLEPHISAKEWDVVAQLAFQLLERNVDGAADTLLSSLDDDQTGDDSEGQANRLNFAVRSLEFLVPSPPVTKNLVKQALDGLMQSVASGAGEQGGTGDASLNTVLALFAANPENRGPIQDVLVGGLKRYLNATSTSIYAAELSLNPGVGNAKDREFANEFTKRIVVEYGDALRTIAHSDPWISTDLVMIDGTSAEQTLADHGLEPFCRERIYRLFSGTRRVPLAEIVVASMLWRYPGALSIDVSAKILSALASRLTVENLSQFGGRQLDRGWLASFQSKDFSPCTVRISDLTEDQRYALVLLTAYFGGPNTRHPGLVRSNPSELMRSIGAVIHGLAIGDLDRSDTDVSRLELTEAQLDAVLTVGTAERKDSNSES